MVCGSRDAHGEMVLDKDLILTNIVATSGVRNVIFGLATSMHSRDEIKC
jgi:hypothetical protein